MRCANALERFVGQRKRNAFAGMPRAFFGTAPHPYRYADKSRKEHRRRTASERHRNTRPSALLKPIRQPDFGDVDDVLLH